MAMTTPAAASQRANHPPAAKNSSAPSSISTIISWPESVIQWLVNPVMRLTV